jgi:hypothetical protein
MLHFSFCLLFDLAYVTSFPSLVSPFISLSSFFFSIMHCHFPDLFSFQTISDSSSRRIINRH